jgi:hypothetical protein
MRNVIRQNAECSSSRVNYIPHFRIREQVLDFRDGHKHTVTEKRARVEAAALRAMRAPTDKGQLRSFIGCVQLGMDAAALTTVLNQGDQGENLIPPRAIPDPDSGYP